MPSLLARAKKFTKAAVTLSTNEKRLGNLRKGKKAVPADKCSKKQARRCKQWRRGALTSLTCALVEAPILSAES